MTRPFWSSGEDRYLEQEAVARYAADGVDPSAALPLRALLTTPLFRTMMVLTALFYGFFTLVANTFGAFKTYFLVTVGGTTQTTATALSFGTTLIGLAGTIAFTRIADTRWRSRFFVVGVAVFTACQLLIAVTGGTVLPAMIAWSPSGLFFLLTAFALVSGAVGAVIIRRTRGSRPNRYSRPSPRRSGDADGRRATGR